MFEPVAYREVAAEAVRDFIYSREYSSDPDVRKVAHFDHQLSPAAFHEIISRPISKEDIMMMKTVGYRILEFGAFKWEDVIEGLLFYKGLHNNINVQKSFIIDESQVGSEIGFPMHLEGLHLGEAVAALQSGDIDGFEDLERKKTLDSIGFDWGDLSSYQRYRFVPMILGLQIFKHLHGFPMPNSEFVVPDEPQWPTWMVGMPLGEWTTIARIQQKMIEEWYPHRKDMLNALEFLWWIPPGSVNSKYFIPLKQ